MRVSVLQPSYRDSASPLRELDFRRDLTSLLPGHQVEHVFLDKATVARDLRRLHADVFVNLCDGAWDEDTPGIDVVRALAREERAFTGADEGFYDPTRRAMKQACLEHDIPSPAHLFAFDPGDVARAAADLRPPWFVKPPHGYNSVGIDAASRADSAAALTAQAERVMAEFGGALIEEYVDGREFSVLVASDPADPRRPRTYLPVECLFPPGLAFKTFEHKWVSSRNPWRPCPEPRLAARLQEMTRDLFLALGGNGYARSDIRVDGDGNPFLLEINPNCSLFYAEDNGATADLILAFDGTPRADFLAGQMEFARARARRTTAAYAVDFDDARGGVLRARRDLAPDETIYVLEEERQVVVSRGRVERHWSPADQETFRRYAYPLGGEVFALWDEDPGRWRPINHACDPSAWVEGLDLVARRAIAAGEEITLDYATMYTAPAAGFACACGARLCRGGPRPDDCRQPWFAARYGEHVTDHVRRAQRSGPSPGPATAGQARQG